MSKLFITGGTGFWGKNVLNYILHNDLEFNEVFILSRNPNIFLERFPQFNSPKFTFIVGDIRSFSSDIDDIDYIMHLATDASKQLNDNDPLEMMDVILNGTKHILKFAAQQKQLKRFLFASSGAVYGNIPENIPSVKEENHFELDFNDPSNAYAQSKRTAEMMCQIYFQKYNLPILIVRGFSFYGDYMPQNSHFAMPNFVHQAKTDKKIILNSDGSSHRSYMHAQDLSKNLISLLLKDRLQNFVLNIGSDKGHSIKDWASEIAATYGNIPVMINTNSRGNGLGLKHYIPNIDKLKKELGTNFVLNDLKLK